MQIDKWLNCPFQKFVDRFWFVRNHSEVFWFIYFDLSTCAYTAHKTSLQAWFTSLTHPIRQRCNRILKRIQHCYHQLNTNNKNHRSKMIYWPIHIFFSSLNYQSLNSILRMVASKNDNHSFYLLLFRAMGEFRVKCCPFCGSPSGSTHPIYTF